MKNPIHKSLLHPRENWFDPLDKRLDLQEKTLSHQGTNPRKHATHETHEDTRPMRFTMTPVVLVLLLALGRNALASLRNTSITIKKQLKVIL